MFSSFTSCVRFRDEMLGVKNDCGQIHTDTSPKQEVKPARVLPLFGTSWYL